MEVVYGTLLDNLGNRACPYYRKAIKAIMEILLISSFVWPFTGSNPSSSAMLRRLTVAGALVIALLAILPSLLGQAQSTPGFVQGRNQTVLFLVNDHHGFSNVHLATTQGLLELYPEIEIHFASFPKLGEKFGRLASYARRREPRAKDIIFHPLDGPSHDEALRSLGEYEPDSDGLMGLVSPPGLPGVKKLAADAQRYLAPWSVEEHFALYEQARRVIDKIDPAVVVLDTIIGPAIEATRSKNRLHAFITPNTLIDNFPGEQPWLGMLWKYPA